MISQRKHINTEQLAVFVIHQQILKKGQGHLQITDIPLVRCPQGYLDLGQMLRIYKKYIKIT